MHPARNDRGSRNPLSNARGLLMATLKFPCSRQSDALERLPFGRKHPTERNRLKFNSVASSRRESGSTVSELARDIGALAKLVRQNTLISSEQNAYHASKRRRCSQTNVKNQLETGRAARRSWRRSGEMGRGTGVGTISRYPYLRKFEISFKHIGGLRGSWRDGAGSKLALVSQMWSPRPVGSRRVAGVVNQAPGRPQFNAQADRQADR